MRLKTYDENCQYRCTLKLATNDIEEIIARCGWTCVEDMSELTPEDKEEISRIEKQGFASMTTQTSADALKWWNERKL
jgi:hypothetical protein